MSNKDKNFIEKLFDRAENDKVVDDTGMVDERHDVVEEEIEKGLEGESGDRRKS